MIAATLCACAAIDETATVTSDLHCDVWGCGANSATVGDGIIFDELDASGNEPNRGGVVITGAQAWDHQPVQLRVRRHELYAVGASGEYHGQALVDLVIQLKSPTNHFELKIERVQEQALQFWVAPYEWVPFYDIKARLDDGPFKELICKRDVVTEDPRWESVAHSALVFQWDHYDAAAKTVEERPSDTTWFNLACAATAPAKLHLLRHTRAGSYLDTGERAVPTTVERRQAMLKMFTADYCGTGEAFTVDGTPLRYEDAAHLHPADLTGTTTEAIWSPSGPICLDTPRLAPLPTVEADCKHALPACGDITKWSLRGDVISANPP